MGKKPGTKGRKGSTQPRVLPGSLVLSVEGARKFLALLNDEGLSGEDRLAILNADGKGKPVANNRDPLFFDDLIPSNFRREGIWQRSLNAVVEADPTAAKTKRDVYTTPAGLTNLGNTCYANSALQVLYTNKMFREAIYSVEEEVVEGDATGMLSELRKLFLDMQFCDNTIADPRAFANMLKLQASEQQDAQEFQKLLMQRLEERMQRSAKPLIKCVLANLYSGQSSYVTRCRKCCQESRMSSEVSEYFELDLQVKGVKTLEKSLQALVDADALEGNNQYSCENCGCKQDADRQFCVRRLPPCLRINLQRFVFDWQSLQKQKCKDAISFPMNIDLTNFVHPVQSCTQPEQPMQYTLTAIILHRGSSASSGHYVSIVKDERLGLWWKYDDESVTKMGVHPFKGAKTDPISADGDSNGSLLPKKSAAKKKMGGKAAKGAPKAPNNAAAAKSKCAKGGQGTRGAKKSEVLHIDEDPTSPAEVQVVDIDAAPAAPAEDASAAPAASAQAINVRRKRSLADVSDSAPATLMPETLAGSTSCTAKRVCSMQPRNGTANDVQMCSPEHVAGQQQGKNGRLSADGGGAEAKLGTLAQDLSSKDAYMLIYTQAGYNCGSCVPEHGCESMLPPGTREILESMQDSRAQEDAEEAAQQSSLKAAVEERRDHIRAVVNVIKPDLNEPEDAFFIDADWLTKWANAPPSEEMPAISNADLVCEHGGLDPQAWDAGKRISRAAWCMLKAQWGGGPELTQKDLCVECTNTQLEEIVQKQDIDVQRKSIVEQVKRCLEASADSVETDEGSMLVSRKWVANWKARACKLSYLSDCMSPTASITCRHGKLLPAKTGKGSNRVAITAEVFSFISTHWRPPNTPRSGSANKQVSTGDACQDADDVEVIDAEPLKNSADGSDPAAGPDTIDVTDVKEPHCQVQRGTCGVHADDAGDGTRHVAAADRREGSEKGDSIQIEDDDDDVMIATPKDDSGEAKSGKEDRQIRHFLAVDADALQCQECSVLMSDTAEKEANLRKRVLEERNALKTLSSSQLLHLEHGIDYVLVPQSWLLSWRSWITGTPWRAGGGASAVGRGAEVKAKAADTLKSLDEAMADFCVKDEDSGEVKLLHELPAVAQHRGKWAQVEISNDAGMNIIEASQWDLLKEYHGSNSTPELRVTFTLEDAPAGGVSADPCSDATPPQPTAHTEPPLDVELNFAQAAPIEPTTTTEPVAAPAPAAVELQTAPSGCTGPVHGPHADAAPGAPAELPGSKPPGNNKDLKCVGSVVEREEAQPVQHAGAPGDEDVTLSAPVPAQHTATQPSPHRQRPADLLSPAADLASTAADLVQRPPATHPQHAVPSNEPLALGLPPSTASPADEPCVPVVPDLVDSQADYDAAAALGSAQHAPATGLHTTDRAARFPGFQRLPRGAGEHLQTPHLRQWDYTGPIALAAEGALPSSGALAPQSSGGALSAQPSDITVIRASLPTPGSEPTTINISPASVILGEGSFVQVPALEPIMAPVHASTEAETEQGTQTAAAAVRAQLLASAEGSGDDVASAHEQVSGTAAVCTQGTASAQLGTASAVAIGQRTQPLSAVRNRCGAETEQRNAAGHRGVDAAGGAMRSSRSAVAPQETPDALPENSLEHNSLLPQRRSAQAASLDKEGPQEGLQARKCRRRGAPDSNEGPAAAAERDAAEAGVGRMGSKQKGANAVQHGQDVSLHNFASRTRGRIAKAGSSSASGDDSQGAGQAAGAPGDAAAGDAVNASNAGSSATAAAPKVGVLQPQFTVCRASIQQRELERRSSLLVFNDTPLLCQLVTHEQAVTDNVPVASSKRSRRGRVVIKASHSLTLRSLKLRLYSDLDVHPMNMDCYVQGRLLENDDLSLQQLQVGYTDVINIVKVDRVSNDDYALLIEWQNMTGLGTDVVVAAKTGGAAVKERGFVDTLLVGGP